MARSKQRTEFLSDVLTTAIEGGINYWASVVSYDGATSATILDELDGYTINVTLDTIAKGWGLYQKEPHASTEYGKQALLANRTNGEDGDYDADVADQVLQLGALGDVIFG